jgi:hypothetical protein
MKSEGRKIEQKVREILSKDFGRLYREKVVIGIITRQRPFYFY